MNTPPLRTIHSVSELADILRALVEDALPRVWVEGEVSNFSRPASGHWYFTLKDANAQIRCAMFRNANYLVRPQPVNGDKVLVRAQATLYTARGDLQLIAEHLEPAGTGALLRAFEDLKRRLLAEGLFDAARKRPLPALPRRVGLITSATGAAVRDVLAAFARRFPLLQVTLWPVPVQGNAAASAIVEALQRLPARAPVDVILLVRGGGALEDLWAFNDERVARAIRGCAVPVVTGIGHETDTTIADFAADLRAPTPTAGAELLSPDRLALAGRVESARASLAQASERALRERDRRLRRAVDGLQRAHPRRALQGRAQQLDDAMERLADAQARWLTTAGLHLKALGSRLAAQRPLRRLDAQRGRLSQGAERLVVALRANLRLRRSACEARTTMLNSLSPLAVLERGYAIVRDRSGTVLLDGARLADGEEFAVLLARGPMRARKLRPEADGGSET